MMTIEQIKQLLIENDPDRKTEIEMNFKAFGLVLEAFAERDAEKLMQATELFKNLENDRTGEEKTNE